jgi:cupin 2 domain-containing protein
MNLFADLFVAPSNERIDELLTTPNVRIERILSMGQASPPGFWYDQEQHEWVALLAGSAGVLFAGEAEPRVLRPGDFLNIPAHTRHRVEWTADAQPTVWLAVHYDPVP